MSLNMTRRSSSAAGGDRIAGWCRHGGCARSTAPAYTSMLLPPRIQPPVAQVEYMPRPAVLALATARRDARDQHPVAGPERRHPGAHGFDHTDTLVAEDGVRPRSRARRPSGYAGRCRRSWFGSPARRQRRQAPCDQGHGTVFKRLLARASIDQRAFMWASACGSAQLLNRM